MAARQDPDLRTGIFTTGIIAQSGPLSAALFCTLKNAVESTPRRKGAETQSFLLLSPLTPEPGRDAFHRVCEFAGKEWDAVERVPTGFNCSPRHLPAPCAFAALPKQPGMSKRRFYGNIIPPLTSAGFGT